MRIRLAADDQLGSHTPRPQAPADSLASFQVHESVINNVIAAAGVGRPHFHAAGALTATSPAASAGRQPADDPDHDDVSITFAAKDAVRVRFAEGRVE